MAPLLFDRSSRTRWRVTGSQRVATLNGLVTNDVAALQPGQGQYAAVLTPKGKIIADVRLFMDDEAILVDTSERAAPGLTATFTKFVNPRFATVTNVSADLLTIGITGDSAAHTITTITGISPETLAALTPYAHLQTPWNNTTLTIARAPDLGAEGYDLFVPHAHHSSLHDALVAAGATTANNEAWLGLRVAMGWPEWGIDMDDTTLPQEAHLETLRAISYNKGCYVGQETVARIHFRGHVNRTLRRLAIAGPLRPPPGSELRDADGKVVGDVRSTAVLAPQRFAGIGMVRREIETGTTLTVHWNDSTARTEVIGETIGYEKGAVT